MVLSSHWQSAPAAAVSGAICNFRITPPAVRLHWIKSIHTDNGKARKTDRQTVVVVGIQHTEWTMTMSAEASSIKCQLALGALVCWSFVSEQTKADTAAAAAAAAAAVFFGVLQSLWLGVSLWLIWLLIRWHCRCCCCSRTPCFVDSFCSRSRAAAATYRVSEHTHTWLGATWKIKLEKEKDDYDDF